MTTNTLSLRAAKRGAIQSASRRTVAANEEDGSRLNGWREEGSWWCLSIGYQWTRPSGHSRACPRQTRHLGVYKRQEAAACLRAAGDERMLGGTHLISSTFPATSMHMDERKRRYHESPCALFAEQPGKKEKLKPQVQKKRKITTRAAVDKGATQPGGGGRGGGGEGEKSSAARVSIPAMIRRIEK